jgi:hypothetical protein
MPLRPARPSSSALVETELDVRLELFVVVVLLPVLRIAPFLQELVPDFLRIVVRLQECKNSRPGTFESTGDPATEASINDSLKNMVMRKGTYAWQALEASPAKKS